MSEVFTLTQLLDSHTVLLSPFFLRGSDSTLVNTKTTIGEIKSARSNCCTITLKEKRLTNGPRS